MTKKIKKKQIESTKISKLTKNKIKNNKQFK